MSYYNRGLYGGWAPTMTRRSFEAGSGETNPHNLIEAYMTSRYAPDKDLRKAARTWMSAKRRANRKAYERAGRQRNAYIYQETKVRKPRMTRAGRDAIWDAWSTAPANAPINAYISHGNWGQANINPYQSGGGRGVWNDFVRKMFRHGPFVDWYTGAEREKPLADIAAYWRKLRVKPSIGEEVDRAVAAWQAPGGRRAARSAVMDDDDNVPSLGPPPARSIPDTGRLRILLEGQSGLSADAIKAVIATAAVIQGDNDAERLGSLQDLEKRYGSDAAHWANAIN